MNSNAFRHLYNYHFAENRALWEQHITQLSDKQFAEPLGYSIGSIRNQILHLINVDEVWFSDLRGAEPPDPLTADTHPDYASIRQRWDQVEQDMRSYLDNLQDDMLNTKPLSGEDANLILWQILLHVINHSTDHRAQILRQLNDFGQRTVSQDYIFFAYDNPVK